MQKNFVLNDLATALAEGNERVSAAAIQAISKEALSRLSVDRRDEDSDWFDRVADLLMRSDDDFAASDRIECLLVCSQWFQKEGKNPLGVAAAEKAVSIAERTGNFPLLRRCYSILGNVHNGTKDFVQATVCYARAVELARSIGDRVGECASIANLAAARLHSGLLEESRTLNALVIDMATALEKQDVRLVAVKEQAHHNVALASFLLGDIFIARTNIEYAISKGVEPRNKFEAYQRVKTEYTYVRILSKEGEFETARERAGIAREYASQVGSKPADLHASLAESACDSNEGKWDIALTRLSRLYDESRTLEIIRRDVLEALILTNEKAGHHVEAKRLHKEYLNTLSQLQRKSARTQLHALKRNFQLPIAQRDRESTVLPASVFEKLRARDREIWQTFRDRLEAMAVLAELRDDATGEHAFRVGRLCAIFAGKLGYSEHQVQEIELAARLHDIGKLVVPDVVLQKRGKLVEVEVEVMRRHATEGAAILMEVQHEAFRPAAEIALSHHEWWDGNGYPQRLAGDAIPEPARITALADVFDALTHKRPYKPAWPFDRSVNLIREMRGRQFEPRLCDMFVDLINDLHSEHKGELDTFLGRDANRSEIVNANRLIDSIVQEHKSLLLS